MQQQLINFLSGSGVDDRGRAITEIIAWSDAQLESCHDYIQWVFPNRSPSQFNPGAPTLDDDTASQIKSCPQAIKNVRGMLVRMYKFYSFKVITFEDGDYQLDSLNASQKPWWITPGNHNYLRLTRILKTLKLLCLDDDVDALADILDILGRKYRQTISEKTLGFWRDASGYP